MNYPEDKFQAEIVEEQIDHISRESAAQSMYQQIITDLQAFYASDTGILENVWQRLEAHQETNGTLQSQSIKDTHRKGKPLIDIDKSTHISHDVGNTRSATQRRWPRMVRTLAAVLVATLLVGSVLALFNSRNHSQPNVTNGTPSIPSQATAAHSAASATAGPPPKLDCSHVFDGGEHAVCTQGDETDLYVTRMIAGEQFTLASAYADPNRVILKYIVAGPPISEANQVNLSTLTIQGHLAQNGPSNDAHYYNAQKKLNIGISSFSNPSIPVGATELQVTVTVNVLEELTNTTSGAINAINSAVATINFTIPFQSATHVATPNRTMYMNGDAVTLTQVVVAKSQTEIFFTSAEYFQLSDVAPFQGTLTLPSGEKFTNINFYPIAATNAGYITGWHFLVPEDLFSQQGTWTVTLSSTGGFFGKSHGTFQFNLAIIE